jgi:hypothetical protein
MPSACLAHNARRRFEVASLRRFHVDFDVAPAGRFGLPFREAEPKVPRFSLEVGDRLDLE